MCDPRFATRSQAARKTHCAVPPTRRPSTGQPYYCVVRIGAFGSLWAERDDGTEVELGGTLERRVLAALVTGAGALLTTDALFEAVFGVDVPASATVRLQNHVSRLRKRLGADVIVTEALGYRINPDATQLDWVEFERLVREATAISESDPSAAVALFAEAFNRWRGAPFRDIEEWTTARMLSARLDEMRRVAQESHAEALIASGRSTDATGLLDALVAEDPLRERRWMLLMLALHRSGRRAEALRAFQSANREFTEVGLDLGQELRALERAISAQDQSLGTDPLSTTVRRGTDSSVSLEPRPQPPERSSLPNWSDAFVGRVWEIESGFADVRAHRLTTLTGAGGAGKSRLAAEIGRLAITEFDAGVWFVELAPVTDPSAVATTLATALSIRPQAGASTRDAILDWLHGRHLLLIIDNCEHLLDAVADLVGAIVTATPTVTVLATSREPLAVHGERIVPIPSMSDDDAVALFVDRAGAADPSVWFTADDIATIGKICGRLDGIPLGIEFAAARVRSLTLPELLSRLNDRFRLLHGPGRGRLERHQTLRATVAWSYDLLTDLERALFTRVSVFAGGFDLAAAEHICSGDGVDEADVLPLLVSLVDKSMVIAERQVQGTRYRLLETLRQFGEERLAADDATQWRDQHLRHYVVAAERNDAAYRSPGQRDANAWFDREWDNIRFARAWALSTGDFDRAFVLVAASFDFAIQWLRVEHADWLKAALATAGSDRAVTAKVNALFATWMAFIGTAEHAISFARQGLEHDQGFDPQTTTWCWHGLSAGLFNAGRGGEAWEAAPHAIAASRGVPFLESVAFAIAAWCALVAEPDAVSSIAIRHRDLANALAIPTTLVHASMVEGIAGLAAGDSQRAIDAFTESLRLSEGVSANAEGVVLQATALALVTATGADAVTHLRRVLTRLYQLRFWRSVWNAIEVAASQLIHGGLVEAGAVLLGHTEANCAVDAFVRTMHDDGLNAVRFHPDSARWLALGARMDRDQLVAHALGNLAELA